MNKMFSIHWDRDSQGSQIAFFLLHPPTLPNHFPTVSRVLAWIAGLPQALFWNCQEHSKRKGMFLPAKGRRDAVSGPQR